MSTLGSTNSTANIPTTEDRLRPLSGYFVSKASDLIASPVVAGISGATYNPLTNTLFLVRETYDGSNGLYEFTVDGVWLRTISLVGFDDPEDLVWMYGETYGIVEEGGGGIIPLRNRITVFQINAGTTSVTRTSWTSYSPSVVTTNNLGIESLCYDPDGDFFYFVTEKPEISGGAPWNLYKYIHGTDTLSVVFSLITTTINGEISDVSALRYSRSNGHFYFLSQESAVILEAEYDGTILSQISTPANVALPEGLALTEDGSDMWVVGEPYHFARLQYRWAAEPARVSQVVLGSSPALAVTYASFGQLVLPGPGTYLLQAEIAIYSENFAEGAAVEGKFRNATASTDIGGERVTSVASSAIHTFTWAFSDVVSVQVATTAELWIKSSGAGTSLALVTNNVLFRFIQLPQA